MKAIATDLVLDSIELAVDLIINADATKNQHPWLKRPIVVRQRHQVVELVITDGRIIVTFQWDGSLADRLDYFDVADPNRRPLIPPPNLAGVLLHWKVDREWGFPFLVTKHPFLNSRWETWTRCEPCRYHACVHCKDCGGTGMIHGRHPSAMERMEIPVSMGSETPAVEHSARTQFEFRRRFLWIAGELGGRFGTVSRDGILSFEHANGRGMIMKIADR